MKRFAAFLLLLVSALAGAARWLDVVNYTDLDTGFVTWGPAWARYAIAGGILALLALGALLPLAVYQSIAKLTIVERLRETE